MGRIFQTFAFLLLAAGTPAFAASNGGATPDQKPAAEQQKGQPSATTEQRLERLEKELADARYQRDIAQIHADLIDRQTSWYEIWTGALIGCFSLLVTVLLVAFSLRFGRQAVQEAKAAATADLDQERQQVRGLLEEAKAAVSQIKADQEEIRQITDTLVAGQAPKDAKERGNLREIAAEALKKPSRERSAAEYRALIVVAFMDEEFETMLRHAQTMEALFADEAKADSGASSNAEDVAFAMFNIAYALGKLDRSEQSIAAYDALVDRFGSNSQPALQEQVAKALFNKGIRLGKLGRPADEISVYDDIVARFGRSALTALQDQVAKALFNKGVILGKLDRPTDEIAVYDDLLARFVDSAHPSLQGQVAMTLLNKGVTLSELKRFEDAIAIYDELLARFGDSGLPAMQKQIAMALVNKGVALADLDRSENAIAIYDDVVARFVTNPLPVLQEQLANALFNKACALAKLSRVADCISVLEQWRDHSGALDCASIADDSDFDRVRDDPKFIAFLAENGCAPPPKPKPKRQRKPRKPSA